MKIHIVSFLCLFLLGQLSAQTTPTFRYEGHSLQLVELIKPGSPIIHDDPVMQNEDERIKLFKQYFHPASYDAFVSFFLPEEWANVSLEEFDQWQHTIGVKKLHLQCVLHLRDAVGREYIVFQYAMEGPAYSVYQSSEFKLTPSGWKHTHLKKDEASECLMRIGTMNVAYIEECMAASQFTINLETIPIDHIRTYREKFNRKEIFNRIESVLLEKGVTKEDRDLARTYFELKDDSAFIESICRTYALDDITLMNALNQAAGMQIYHFTKSQNE